VLPPGLTLRVTVPDTAVPVRGDASQLEQVCLNLLVNARDAMPSGGEVQVVLRVEPGAPAPCAQLEIADTGVGMAPGVQARVFDPFFTTKPLGAGTGIGLAVVYGVVSAHEGTVAIDSEVGKGTTVRITLPLATDDAVPTEVELDVDATTPRHRIADPADRAAPTAAPAPCVLLVDDEPAVRGALTRVLQRAGFEVLEATHGAEALTRWHANAERIAVVVSDMRMPVMGGPEFVRHLRATGTRTPVLLMSGFADEELVRELPPDVAQVLAKPFSTSVLLAAIRDTIDRTSASASHTDAAG
jgi:two-component system cell cycle sensor histidine kinase/response regulator CckA